MIFKQISPAKMDVIDRNVRKVLSTMELFNPDYQPLPDEVTDQSKSIANSPDSDLSAFGKLLIKSGLVVATAGWAIEILPESADTVSHMTVASGLGAAAIGAAVAGYEKVSN